MRELSDKQLVETLFKTVKALCVSEEIICNYNKYNWYVLLSDVQKLDSQSEFIHVYNDDTSDKILSVKKTNIEQCPKPDGNLIKWLKPGWERYKNNVEVFDSLGDENFGDFSQRNTSYKNWSAKRILWAKRQFKLNEIRKMFDEFNKINDFFRIDSEEYELLFAFGIFEDTNDTNIKHPLFTKRVRIEYSDVKNNIITIYNTEDDVRFDSSFLNKVKNEQLKNYDKVVSLLDDDFSIFNKEEVKRVLQNAIHFLSVHGEYYDELDEFYGGNQFIVKYAPLFILRRRTSGLGEFIDKIIDALQTGCKIPKHIVDILHPRDVEVNTKNFDQDNSIDKKLAAVSGEDPDIFMTKPANREQLRIAREIEKYSAVEVQGPPGTGKTHTIANLIGHFLAQGKTVLITSEKIKALTVLRDKLEDDIKPLCVPVFNDNQNEMQHCVTEILGKQGMTSTTVLMRKIAECKKLRQEILDKLNAERRSVFRIRNKEAQDIVHASKSYSVIDVAQMVSDNAYLSAYIPGKVEQSDELPIDFDRFRFIYNSNDEISLEEEKELALDLPNYTGFISPEYFQKLLDLIDEYNVKKGEIANSDSDKFSANYVKGTIMYGGDILFGNPDNDTLNVLMDLLKKMPEYEKWQIVIINDSLIGGGYAQRWLTLNEKIAEYYSLDITYKGNVVGNDIKISPTADFDKLQAGLPNVITKMEQNRNIGSVCRFFNKDIDYVLKNITINGKEICKIEEAKISFEKVKCDIVRETLSRIWDDLFKNSEVALFDDIDDDNTAVYAFSIANKVRDALNWHSQYYTPIEKALEKVNFNMDLLGNEYNFNTKVVDRLKFLSTDLIKYAKIALIYDAKKHIQKEVQTAKVILKKDTVKNSVLCHNLVIALENLNGKEYTKAYNQYKNVFVKLSLYKERMQFFDELSLYAPDWADAIKNRRDAHNTTKIPCDLSKAWKIKQLDNILSDLFSESLEKRQNNILIYSQDLRKKTCELANLMAWMHLLKRVEGRQTISGALNSWAALIRKIGKGTGKLVGIYKKQAQQCMLTGQIAVPAWIIPVKKALETFDPVRNHFDIAIVDEASQSSLEALAITFIADKIIVVGDDKQVSPMLIGSNVNERKEILSKYLGPYIPNWSLFDGRTSFYELVGTVFQPLMLREHFRCVPEIIGYSNEKFYDNQILPLRDSNLCPIEPPIINYRVDGNRDGKRKTNQVEAATIVSLIQACCEQKEYFGKTFGVISLLGGEQAEYINMLISQHIADYSVIKERELICGNSASFQGDERDVIFLSMVDDNSTVRKTSRDDDAKRYNVAVSRAKDQLWAVNSLDYSLLQQDDLHYGLLEYAENYQTHVEAIHNIKAQADSVFEEDVARYLVAQGYNINQQYAVGSYRIDMVVSCQNRKIAIECDGCRYHSGEEKIQQDMERQCILERLGWRFIRIGGGQFYRDKDGTMNAVYRQLAEQNIHPEAVAGKAGVKESELYDRVTRRACEIRASWEKEDDSGIDNFKNIYAVDDQVNKNMIAETDNQSVYSKGKSTSPQKVNHSQTTSKIQRTITFPIIRPIRPSGYIQADSIHKSNTNDEAKIDKTILKNKKFDIPSNNRPIVLGDTVLIKYLGSGKEIKYRMMQNSIGKMTELTRICKGCYVSDIVEYQGEQCEILSIDEKKQ